MKAVIQKVIKASVTVGDRVCGSIGQGLCVLIGINRNDTEKEMEYIVRKILNTRIFTDEDSTKRWDKSVKDMDFEILCISQFTLDAYLKGNKPDFSRAMGPEQARILYNKILETLKCQYKPDKIQDGAFGEYMQVHIQNDGPVTIPIECVPKNSQVKVKDESQNASTSGASAATQNGAEES